MKNFHARHSRTGFTLVEIMIVAAILAITATIAVPNWLRARKRSQATRILDDLRCLDHAVEIYSIENHRSGAETTSVADFDHFRRYLKTGIALYTSLPNDFFGNPFTIATLEGGPKLSSATFAVLSDVAPVDFWSPYYP